MAHRVVPSKPTSQSILRSVGCSSQREALASHYRLQNQLRVHKEVPLGLGAAGLSSCGSRIGIDNGLCLP